MLTELLKHQKRGVRWLLSLEPQRNNDKPSSVPGGILGDEMGLGKTIQTIALIEKSHLNVTAIFAPASLTKMWFSQIIKFSDAIEPYILGDEAELVEFLHNRDRSKKTVVISSYGLSFRRPILKEIPFDRLVCDEAHYFRNPKSRTFNFLRSLQSKSRILLTGTPVQNKVADIVTLINFIMKTDIKLPIDFIKLFIKKRMLARTLESVGIKLPQIEEIDKHYTSSKDNQRVINTVKNIDLNPLVKILRQKQSCVFPDTLNSCDLNEDNKINSKDNSRSNLIIEHVNKHKSKCLIFTEFRHEQKYIYSKLKDQFNVGVINGSISLDERAQICDDHSLDIIIIQIQTGCVGLNLQHFSTIYFSNRQWNPTIILQAIGRIRRIGQKNEMKVYHFTFEGSIEERINYIANQKLKIIDDLLKSD